MFWGFRNIFFHRADGFARGEGGERHREQMVLRVGRKGGERGGL